MAKTVKNLVVRDGIYYVRKKVGDRVVRVSTKQTDKGCAEIVAVEIIARLNREGVDAFIGKKAEPEPEPAPTYGERAKALLALVAGEESKRSYEDYLNPSIAAWGALPINEVTSTMCLDLLAARRKQGFAHNSGVVMMRLTGLVFNRAIADHVLTENPWTRIDRKSKPKPIPRDRVLPKGQEEAAFFEGLGSEGMRRICRVLIGAGLRISEACSLVPRKHLDFATSYIRLSRDITKGGKKRAVPMFPDVKDALLEQLAEMGLSMQSQDELFPYSPGYVEKMCVLAWRAADIERTTPHDLRRTFGTRMALMRTPMKTLQRWMGHSKIEITAQFYVHLDEATDAAIAQEIAAQLPAGKLDAFTKKKTGEGEN